MIIGQKYILRSKHTSHFELAFPSAVDSGQARKPGYGQQRTTSGVENLALGTIFPSWAEFPREGFFFQFVTEFGVMSKTPCPPYATFGVSIWLKQLSAMFSGVFQPLSKLASDFHVLSCTTTLAVATSKWKIVAINVPISIEQPQGSLNHSLLLEQTEKINFNVKEWNTRTTLLHHDAKCKMITFFLSKFSCSGSAAEWGTRSAQAVTRPKTGCEIKPC